MKNIWKALAVGALLYGAYKLGEKHGEKKLVDNQELGNESNQIEDAEVVESKSEMDKILEIMDSIRKKPNKTQKDRNTLDLLKIKLDQLIKQL